MSDRKQYVHVVGQTPRAPMFGYAAPARFTYRADSWKRLTDRTLIVLLGDREVATWAPGAWNNASLKLAATIEEAHHD